MEKPVAKNVTFYSENYNKKKNPLTFINFLISLAFFHKKTDEEFNISKKSNYLSIQEDIELQTIFLLKKFFYFCLEKIQNFLSMESFPNEFPKEV